MVSKRCSGMTCPKLIAGINSQSDVLLQTSRRELNFMRVRNTITEKNFSTSPAVVSALFSIPKLLDCHCHNYEQMGNREHHKKVTNGSEVCWRCASSNEYTAWSGNTPSTLWRTLVYDPFSIKEVPFRSMRYCSNIVLLK